MNNLENRDEKKKNMMQRMAYFVTLSAAVTTMEISLAELIAKNNYAKENEPIYYSNELDEYYTETGKDIYKITEMVPAKDYPCEKSESVVYVAPEGFFLEGGKAVKTTQGEHGQSKKVVVSPTVKSNDVYEVTFKENTALFGKDNSFKLDFTKNDIDASGAIYNDETKRLCFPEKCCTYYTFDVKEISKDLGGEIIDIEKIETTVLDESMLDDVVNVRWYVETVNQDNGKSLGKTM